MKILVTGGAGFIGSHVCERLLSEGHQVVSLDNFNDFYDPRIKESNIVRILFRAKPDHFKSVKGDIREASFLDGFFLEERPELVVHLAAMAGVRPSIQNPALYEDVNVHGTRVLLEAVRKFAVKNFVFASSSSVYGNSQRVPFSEKDTLEDPISPYAVTKKAGETLCQRHCADHGTKSTCLRFFTAYGPRQRPDLAIHKFTKLILEDKPIHFFGDGTTRRDYTHIDDILDGVSKAVLWTKDGPTGQFDIFNLGESRTVSLKELVEVLEKALGKKAVLEKLPLQRGDVNVTFADISKAKKVLGYLPSVEFEEGIGGFISWYRENEALWRQGHSA